jgi:dienelactone hydrolase
VPRKVEKKTGIIIVHEWWGHNDYARKRADMLASEGYVAMSIDMYGNGKLAQHPKDAGAFAKQATKDFQLTKKRFTTALKILKQRKDVDKKKIAAIGYCFGGAIVLNMARAGVDLDLIGSFHGSLASPLKAQKGKVKAKKILVFNGAKDPMIKSDHITSFKKEMDSARLAYEFYNYPEAVHAFTNPEADKFGKKI